MRVQPTIDKVLDAPTPRPQQGRTSSEGVLTATYYRVLTATSTEYSRQPTTEYSQLPTIEYSRQPLPSALATEGCSEYLGVVALDAVVHRLGRPAVLHAHTHSYTRTRTHTHTHAHTHSQ